MEQGSSKIAKKKAKVKIRLEAVVISRKGFVILGDTKRDQNIWQSSIGHIVTTIGSVVKAITGKVCFEKIVSCLREQISSKSYFKCPMFCHFAKAHPFVRKFLDYFK